MATTHQSSPQGGPRHDVTHDKEELRLAWRVVALFAGVVAIGALTALAVSVGSKSDALNTAAIVVAIVAFLFQLVIFVAQAIQSNAVAVRLEQIAATLGADLIEFKEKLSGVSEDVKAIRAAKAAGESIAEDLAEDPTADPREISARFLEGFKSALAAATDSEAATALAGTASDPVRDGPTDVASAPPPGEPRQVRRRMGDPTSEDRESVVPVLAELSDDGFAEFVRIKAIDNTIPDYKTPGAWSSRSPDDATLKDLESRGLIAVWNHRPYDRVMRRGSTFVQLRPPLGLAAGRVVHGDGFVTRYLNQAPLVNPYRARESESDDAGVA